MIQLAGLLTSLLLPGLVGYVWLDVLWHRRPLPAGDRASPTPMLLGYGYLVGIVATTLVMRGLDAVGLDQKFWLVAGILLAVLAAGLVLDHRRPAPPTPPREPAGRPSPWAAAGIALFAVLILAHLYLAATEVVMRPLYPWDTWAAWAQKTRVWYELGQLVPFVPAKEWHGSLAPGRFTAIASQYPPTIPLIQVWTLLGLGHWDDALMNIPWLLCTGALGLALYGQLRLWGLSALAAVAAVYLAVSLPMLDTHTALAGYADLWLAASYAFAAMATCQWCRNGDRRQALLAVATILIATQIKREGLVWALTLTPALLLGVLPRRAFYTVAVALGLGITGLLAAGSLALAIPAADQLAMLANGIDIPGVGTVPVAVADVSGSFVNSMAVDDNWHLLWYAAAALLLFAPWARTIRAEPGFGAAWLTVAAALGMVLGAFFLTKLSAWALDLTTINRVLLHMAPFVVFTVAVASDALTRRSRWANPPG